jgi:bifunctional DNA-binding transcriptional regulator/antitoxin component of YhaV-PrlF toxin-antitoxin module
VLGGVTKVRRNANMDSSICVTIPSEIKKGLDLKVGDLILFKLEGGKIVAEKLS